jgi:PsbP-like protein
MEATMTTHTSKGNRAPWILVGVLGCSVLCLCTVLISGGAYFLLSAGQVTGLSGIKHFDNSEFSFDYPGTWQPFDDFWPSAYGVPYKVVRDPALDAEQLTGVLVPASSLMPPQRRVYWTSVRIETKVLPAGDSLQEVYKRTYSQGYPKSDSISDRTLSVNGVTALEKIYRKPLGEPWYQVREVWLQKNGKIYIISCWAFPSSFEARQPAFNLIVDSFRVK